MRGPADETVGKNFNVDLLQLARNKTLEVIGKVAQSVGPGMSEKEAHELLQKIQNESGAPKSWHPPQIRFGENTILSFGKIGRKNIILQENDIFFFDIGPIFDHHEGDVGRPFTVGNNSEMARCCQDAEIIWFEVKEQWSKGFSGGELYAFAQKTAKDKGWILSLEKANGHRIADFPHAAKARGSIEEFGGVPAPNRWILEIQIRHPKHPFGAFYEDLLN